jgi:hypothetical protein
MERELWKSLYQLAWELDNSWKQGRYLKYEAAVIVGVYLWASFMIGRQVGPVIQNTGPA